METFTWKFSWELLLPVLLDRKIFYKNAFRDWLTKEKGILYPLSQQRWGFFRESKHPPPCSSGDIRQVASHQRCYLHGVSLFSAPQRPQARTNCLVCGPPCSKIGNCKMTLQQSLRVSSGFWTWGSMWLSRVTSPLEAGTLSPCSALFTLSTCPDLPSLRDFQKSSISTPETKLSPLLAVETVPTSPLLSGNWEIRSWLSLYLLRFLPITTN